MNTTEAFRSLCRRIPEEAYGKIFVARAKFEGHKPRLPNEKQKTGVKPSVYREVVLAEITGKEQTTAEVHARAGGNRETLRSHLNALARRNIINRRKGPCNGNTVSFWWAS